jgi:hypothetical protein
MKSTPKVNGSGRKHCRQDALPGGIHLSSISHHLRLSGAVICLAVSILLGHRQFWLQSWTHGSCFWPASVICGSIVLLRDNTMLDTARSSFKRALHEVQSSIVPGSFARVHLELDKS